MVPQRKLYFAITLSGVLLLGFVATSVISYFVAQHSLDTRIAEETLPLTSDNIYSEIEQDLLRSILISSLMAHDTFLRDWAASGEDNPVEILRYLQEIQRKYETTTTFFVSEDTRRYYHPDGVLKRVRETDTICRWGGDEFLVLLADCSLDDARRIAENIRAAVAERTIRHGDHDIRVTVSIGCAEQAGDENLTALAARADAALYASKREGRDRVSQG